jgi:hypothetical protein
MKNLIAALGLIGSLLVLTTGCISSYMPNVPNVPMFTSQGELSAGAHATLKGNINFNTAYAVSDHVGVMLNGSMLSSQRKKRDFRHNLLEAGGGYFTTFGPQGNRVFEVYAGLGRGSSDRIEKERTEIGPITYDRREASFNKYFLQVNYSSKRRESLRLFRHQFPLNYGTALRASYLDMYKYRHNGSSEPTESNIFLEPIFFTRLTLNPSVQLQYTSGSNFGLRNRKVLTAGYSVFSLGFVINVGGNGVTPVPKQSRK